MPEIGQWAEARASMSLPAAVKVVDARLKGGHDD
jgi:hypothetical protein